MYSLIIVLALALIPSPTSSGGKMYQPKGDKKIYGSPRAYTRQQQIQQGTRVEKKFTTCRLMKTLKSRTTGQQACIYRGGNKTYELMYENNCPKQYKCVYNPGQVEPNIDDVITSLNQIKK